MGWMGVGVAAAAAVPAGVGLWWWLRRGSYRVVGDEPQRSLTWAWLVAPAAVAAGVAAGLAGSWPAVVVAWVYLVGAVAVGWIDLDVHRVPDSVLIVWAPLLAMTTVGVAAAAGAWAELLRAGVAAAVLGGVYLVLALVGSMGLGDVKLAAVTGVLLGWLGWPALVTGTVAAFGLAAVAAVGMLVRGADRRSHLAFGPAIIAGAAVAVLHTGLSW